MSSFYIPKPCHEDWNKMTPKEKGRHCEVCSKVVVDFSQKKQEEIIAIIRSKPEGTVCGHFNVNQLDKKAQTKVFRNPMNLFNRNWKYFAMSVFGFFFLNKKAMAQIDGGVRYMPEKDPYQQHNVNSKTSLLAGVVTNSNGDKISHATITILSGGKTIATVQTNENGFYNAKIKPGQIVNNLISATISHMDYMTKNVDDLAITKENTRLNVILDMEVMIMGKVAYKEPVKAEELRTITLQKYEPIVKDTFVARDIKRVEYIEPKLVETQLTGAVHEVNYLEKEPVKPEIIKESILTNDTTANVEMLKELENSVAVQPVESRIFISPNPTSTYAILHCEKTGSYKVNVYDAKGALQFSTNFSGDQVQLDVSTLQRGTYFVRVAGEELLNTLKLIKE